MPNCPNCGAAARLGDQVCAWCGSGIAPPIIARISTPPSAIPVALASQPFIVQHIYAAAPATVNHQAGPDEIRLERSGFLARFGYFVFGIVSGLFGLLAVREHPWIGSFLFLLAVGGVGQAFDPD